ncbi:MAG: helix-turn-helix transcriptional regulator [Firmicutes bacterium]|nr:helix-turn-helix transcriptional regulator [Bacillota bacterium]
MSGADLAERCGVSYATIQRIEARDRWPSLKLAVRLAAALDVPAGLVLSLAGLLPDPLGRAWAQLDEELLGFTMGLSRAVWLMLRRGDAAPARLAAGRLGFLRRRAGLAPAEVIAPFGLDAPNPELIERAEAGDAEALRQAGLLGNEALCGWALGVGGDPDEALWMMGRFPQEALRAAGIEGKAAAWRSALERALELDRAWAAAAQRAATRGGDGDARGCAQAGAAE